MAKIMRINLKKKDTKIDQILNTTTKMNERLGLIEDRSQQDRELLRHVSQEVQIARSSSEYSRDKVTTIAKNPAVRLGDSIGKIFNKIPPPGEFLYFVSIFFLGIGMTLIALKLLSSK